MPRKGRRKTNKRRRLWSSRMFRTRCVRVYVYDDGDDDDASGWMISFWINDPTKTND